MKEAYRLAHASETVGPRLHRLMHTAFATAKRVISSTALGSGGASIARTAIGTLRHEFAILGRGMDELSILVLGCGAMGTRVLKELAPLRTTATWVANRSPERALRAAERHGATAVRWEDRLEFARRADVVFSTTGSDGFVIEKKDLEGVAPHATTLLIDISVPRNVDPAIAELEGYAVVNIDELRSGENGRVGVRRNIGRAEKICDDAVRDALGWENQTRAVEPAVRTLTETFETIRSRELERNIHRFPSEQQEDVDRLTRSIMQKLIAIPIVRLKAMAESEGDLVSRIEVLNSLFDKGECEE
jgi:glutamyl-tRNA reductase